MLSSRTSSAVHVWRTRSGQLVSGPFGTAAAQVYMEQYVYKVHVYTI